MARHVLLGHGIDFARHVRDEKFDRHLPIYKPVHPDLSGHAQLVFYEDVRRRLQFGDGHVLTLSQSGACPKRMPYRG